MIEQSSSVPIVKVVGATVTSVGISIMLVIILAALVVFGIFYLFYRCREPKYPNY
jgi:flagellar basal body-associated protein FliL